MVLAGVRNQYWHLRIFIQDLLNPAVVNALPGVLLARGSIFGLILGIAEIFRVGDVFGRIEIRVTARWRSRILCVES
jgi:hypothetical protein